MSHTKVMLIALAGVLLTIASGARADSLQLKNGNFVQGKYLGGTDRAVQFAVNGKIRLYDIDEILSISFASASADGGIPSNAADRKSLPSPALKSSAPKSSLIAHDSRAVGSKRMKPAPPPQHAQTRRALGTPAPRARVRSQQIAWEQEGCSRNVHALAWSALRRAALCANAKHKTQIGSRPSVTTAAMPPIISKSAVISD